jgi:hypothetical protein
MRSEDGQQPRRRRTNPGMETNPRFVPFATMHKLQTATTELPRALECISCGDLLLLKYYVLDPKKFDGRCRSCGLRAEDFWKDKTHRKVEAEDAG